MTTKKLLSRAAVGALLVLSAPFAFAQTASTTDAGTTGTSGTAGTTTGSTTPGVPNTGAGGDLATNLALATLGGAVAVGAAFYVARRAPRLS